MDGSAATSGQGKLAPGTGMALVGIAAAVFVVCNDFTALAVALPTIEKDFNTGRQRRTSRAPPESISA
jgi:hypothetical protein